MPLIKNYDNIKQIITLLPVFLFCLLLCSGCGDASPPPIRITTPMAAGAVHPTVELTDGFIVFENVIPNQPTLGTGQPPEQSIRYTYNYSTITEILGLDLVELFARSDLPEYLQPSSENFIYDGFLLTEGAINYGTSGKNTPGNIFGGVGFELHKELESCFSASLIVRAAPEGEHIGFFSTPGLYSEQLLSYTSTVGDTPVSMNYSYLTPALGFDKLMFFATFTIGGLRYGIYSNGLCSQEDFINVVLTIINAYQQQS